MLIGGFYFQEAVIPVELQKLEVTMMILFQAELLCLKIRKVPIILWVELVRKDLPQIAEELLLAICAWDTWKVQMKGHCYVRKVIHPDIQDHCPA
jgi:hypothetical protein